MSFAARRCHRTRTHGPPTHHFVDEYDTRCVSWGPVENMSRTRRGTHTDEQAHKSRTEAWLKNAHPPHPQSRVPAVFTVTGPQAQHLWGSASKRLNFSVAQEFNDLFQLSFASVACRHVVKSRAMLFRQHLP